MKYSDLMAEWLVTLGYTHCFYVGGGNIMHLIESLSKRLECVPVIHEVAAGIAAEYFNESRNDKKALALVTAGPGLTNIITAMAGAYLESRELLVIGGQVKTADLAHGKLRQRGIQEIDGVSIAKPISVRSVLLKNAVSFDEFSGIINHHGVHRKGPVFLEVPIDVQAVTVSFAESVNVTVPEIPKVRSEAIDAVAARINLAKRPVLLLGGGVSRATATALRSLLTDLGFPVATTWNAADRIDADQANYVGRPNTWGQRSANLVMQQADLLIAVGTRLGMQQTGFNWQKFIPNGLVIQIDIDSSELEKGHPVVDTPLLGDANDFLIGLLKRDLATHDEWLNYARNVRRTIPLIESVNQTGDAYISPYLFVEQLAQQCMPGDVIIPCSSGSAFTVMMQTFQQKNQQIIITNKGLASMGYGLSGAIGAAIAHPDRRTILVEGDGGFSQNIQEIGTAAINHLNLKIFIFDDSGYASIRATQRNYFGGRYVGCDRDTGLGLPDWQKLFSAWDVPTLRLNKGYRDSPEFQKLFNEPGLVAFIVTIDPEQTYFPKITSKITEAGSMESNPLHLMSPELPIDQFLVVGEYLK